MPEHAAYPKELTHTRPLRLDRADLIGRVWQFRRADGPVFSPRVRLISDGRVAGHDSAFEALWTLDDGIVTFRTMDGTATTRFDAITRDERDALRLEGDFGVAPELGVRLVLESRSPHAARATRLPRLNVEMGLGTEGSGAAGTLLVLFNSIGKPYDGHGTRWEFFDLPRRLGLDYVRFAERIDPAFWYVDQIGTICDLLAKVIGRGYRRVVLTGLSSGGFASLMVGTRLAQRHPGLEVLTYTINPQTGHAPPHRTVMAGFAPGVPPVCMTDEAYRIIADLPHELAALLAGQTNNATHHVFYDHDNPAERYYVDLIRGFDGVRLHPSYFGVGHMSGCLALMEHGVVHDAIGDLVAHEGGLRPLPD